MKRFFSLLLLLVATAFSLHAEQSDPQADQYYLIANKRNAADLIYETPDGKIETTAYSTTQPVFWQFVPSGKPHCFFIKNATTGHYIGSCKGTPSPNTLVKASAAPIEFYLGKNGEFVRLTSTDCANYDNTGAAPNGLNKDGSSAKVIVWKAGSGNVNSWWKLQQTEYLYEVRPFEPSAEIGRPLRLYLLTNAAGQLLQRTADGTLTWVDSHTPHCEWYFVGQSNREGGYQLVFHAQHQTVNGKRYTTHPNANGSFSLLDERQQPLTVNGIGEFYVKATRSPFAKQLQVYHLPCGGLTDNYVARVEINGQAARTPLIYPEWIAKDHVKSAAAAQPTTYYTLYTASKATLIVGKTAQLSLQLAHAPQEGDSLYVYADWNRDGVFEYKKALPVQQEVSLPLSVPAEAGLGKTRLRLRLTNNGLTEAEEDATGQILDFVAELTDNQSPFTAEVSANDPARGTVSIDTDAQRVTATAKGKSTFICWKEGNHVVSLDPTYQYTLDHDVRLTAVFSPNPELITGLTASPTTGSPLRLHYEGQTLSANSPAEWTHLYLYNIQGSLVATVASNRLSTAGLEKGIYIAHAATPTAHFSRKIFIR